MGRTTDNPGLDESRSAPTYRDYVGETVVRQALWGPLIDWRLVGPRKVVQNAVRGLDLDKTTMYDPAISSQSVQVNLMPEVAAAVLKYLDQIAEPTPSRSGKSHTYRLKKKAPESVEAEPGHVSPRTI